jgi:hypothetical protein
MGHVVYMVKNKNAYRVFVGYLKERNHMDHVGILKCTIKETGRGNMNCIHLDLDKWRGLVKMVTNLWVT